MEKSKKTSISPLFAFTFLLLISIPLTTYLLSQQQTTQSNAAPRKPAVTQAVTPTVTPEATASKTAISVTLLLHGVGKGGDNSNPAANSLSNKNPLHNQRALYTQVINSNSEMVSETKTLLSYDKAAGTFVGTVNIPLVPTGLYAVKVKADGFLRRLVPTQQQITANQTTIIPALELVAGDTNNDNSLNVLDYNALLDCGYGEVKQKANSTCQVHAPADNVDIDDNNVVNSADYNLFLRELSVQDGD